MLCAGCTCTRGNHVLGPAKLPARLPLVSPSPRVRLARSSPSPPSTVHSGACTTCTAERGRRVTRRVQSLSPTRAAHQFVAWLMAVGHVRVMSRGSHKRAEGLEPNRTSCGRTIARGHSSPLRRMCRMAGSDPGSKRRASRRRVGGRAHWEDPGSDRTPSSER